MNSNMMKQLQQMQTTMAKLQDELGDMTVTGSAGGGAVTVTANGHQKVLAVDDRARRPRGGRRVALGHGPRRRQ